MASDLKGKVVFITGASTGIGAAAALAFARAGSRLVIHYNASRDAAEAVAKSVKAAGAQAALVSGDVTQGANIKRIAAELGHTLVTPVVSFVPEGDYVPPSGHMRFPGTIGVPENVFAGVLEGIARTGSLSQAARDMHMSYRRAWLLLEDLNVSFDRHVARAQVGGRGGGGVVLTPFGSDLVAGYRRLDSKLQPLARDYLEEFGRRINSGARKRTGAVSESHREEFSKKILGNVLRHGF